MADLRLLGATMDHAKFLFDVRNDPETVRQSKNQSAVKWEDHLSWLQNTIGDADRWLYTAFAGNSPVGTGRIDIEIRAEPGKGGWQTSRVRSDICEVSISIAPRFRGMGYATQLIKALVVLAHTVGKCRVIRAIIRVENESSIRAFAKNGFQEIGGSFFAKGDNSFLEMQWIAP